MRTGKRAFIGALRPAHISAVIGLVTFHAVAAGAPAQAYQQQVAGAATRLGEAMTKAGRRTLAVVDFTDLQGNTTELGRFLAEQLSVALGAEAGSFEVIDRNHLRALLQEHRLSTTGLIDPQTAQKLGKIAGADCLVSGSITPFSETVNLSLKLLDTNTARILGGVAVDIPMTSTISELLKKGIGTPLIGDGVTQGTPRSAPATMTRDSKGSPEISAVVYGVKITMNECRKAGGIVNCQGTLRNESDGPLRLTFPDYGKVEIVDNLGNQSEGRAAAGTSRSNRYSGSRGSFEAGPSPAVDLEPDLPVKFWINDIEVDDVAANVTARLNVLVEPPRGTGRIRVGGFSGTGGSGERKVVVLRNIALH